MSQQKGNVSTKFERVFEQIDQLKTEVTEMKVRNEIGEKQMEQIEAKIDTIAATLNQIVGKESVRAGIYGVIGSIVSGVIVWVFSLVKIGG